MKRTPRILLLDDDADMLDCWMDILKDKFHAVKTNSPFEAISFLDAGRDIIDLVICDQNMPGMTGVEFAEKMRALKIPIPVILCTGFISKNIQTDPKFLTIVEKPFSPETFLAAVEKALSVSSEETKSINKTLLAIPEIQQSKEILEKILHDRGFEDFATLSADQVLQKYGTGETLNLYLCWKALSSLRLQA